jgi:hypothetical protein
MTSSAERERLVDEADRAKAASIRGSLYKIEREASRGEISHKLRSFYHNLLAKLGEIETEIERRKGDDRP